MLLAAATYVAPPPVTEPEARPSDAVGGDAIGVVWHDQATVEPAIQQRLVDELVARVGTRRTVVGDASTLARARVALELPRARVDVAAGWNAMLAPRAVPAEIIQRIHRALVDALNAPRVKEILSTSGAEAVGSTPDELARFLQSETVKWSKVVRAAGIKSQ